MAKQANHCYWSNRKKNRSNQSFFQKRVRHFKKSPQAAIKLTDSQWEKIKEFSVVVKLEDVQWDKAERCFCPKWEVKEMGKEWLKHGGNTPPPELGAIVADDSSLKMYYKRFPAKKRPNIQLVGAYGCKKVLLAVWRRQLPSQVNRTRQPYTKEQVKRLKKVKYNIIQGKQHHGSLGWYGGFGIRKSTTSLDKAKNFSSLEVYFMKPGASQEDKGFVAECGEQLCFHIAAAKDNVQQAFSGATGTSVVDSGNILSEAMIKGLHKYNPELKNQLPVLEGSQFPAGFVCIDASTEFAHTELDHTYTMIHCPPQEGLGYEEDSGTTFNFYLNGMGFNEKNALKIPLNVGTSVFFSGFFLMHRQERHSDRPLVNVGAYGNQKVHEFGRTTLIRNMENSHPWMPKHRRKSSKEN